MDFTPTFHLDTYPSISPTKPSLLQTGRTIFITGGASGVGLAISRSFVEAGATRLVIVGRRAEILAEAKAELESLTSNSVEILTYPCDIVNETSVENVWKDLKAKSIHVEVLVLNAAIANTTPKGLAEEDLLGRIRETMEMNMFSALRLSNLFLRQGPAKGKAIVSVNASVIQLSPIRPVQIGYAHSKAALGFLLQGIADSLDPEEVQIISYHPGSIKTEAVLKSEWANAPLAWSNVTLPGNFALWAATEEARFLHGRFVWASWDVDELKAMKNFEHPGFCRIGLQGPKPLSSQELFTQMTQIRQSAD